MKIPKKIIKTLPDNIKDFHDTRRNVFIRAALIHYQFETIHL